MSKSSSRVKKWRYKLKTVMLDAMGGKCAVCSYSKCRSALELHHKDPTEKDFSFSQLRASPKSKDIIRSELLKCVLVCANCHREIHEGVTDVPLDSFFDGDIFDAGMEKVIKPKRVYVKKGHVRKILLTSAELSDILLTQFGGNKSALARHLGVTETAIRKRL